MTRTNTNFAAEQVAAISTFLREPRGRTRRLLATNANWLTALERRRNTRLSEAELRRHAALFDFPQARQLRELLADDGRSRLLASFHFGDYVYGLNLLAASFGGRANVVFLSDAPASAASFANMKLAFDGHAPGPGAQLLARSTPGTEVGALLRRRGVQCITFCDFVQRGCARAQVVFLFRHAVFCRGPATLALTNRVPLLPVINWFDGERHQVLLGEQIEPCFFDGENLAGAARRITDDLVRFFEPFFRLNPEQWRYLEALPHFFPNAGAAGSPQP